MRNEIFEGGSFDMCAIMDLIKVRSWSWFKAMVDDSSCLFFSDRCSNPIARLNLGRNKMLLSQFLYTILTHSKCWFEVYIEVVLFAGVFQLQLLFLCEAFSFWFIQICYYFHSVGNASLLFFPLSGVAFFFFNVFSVLSNYNCLGRFSSLLYFSALLVLCLWPSLAFNKFDFSKKNYRRVWFNRVKVECHIFCAKVH